MNAASVSKSTAVLNLITSSDRLLQRDAYIYI